MQAAIVDFYIEQGTDWRRDIQLKDSAGDPYDITGKEIKGQIRPSYSSPDATDFTVTVTDAVEGKFSLSLSHEVTSALTPPPSQDADRPIDPLIYDVEMDFGGSTGIQRLLQGKVCLSPEVTRDEL